MILTPASRHEIPRGASFFQTGFWAAFKESRRQFVRCFLLQSSSRITPLVVCVRQGVGGIPYAYVPKGPGTTMDDEDRGLFLEELSLLLQEHLGDVACVRYDTEFPTPYTQGEYWSDNGHWKGPPRTEIRELRMNYGTRTRMLRKAPYDHFSPDTVLVDLRGSESDVLARMRQTTRHSIRKAYRSPVLFESLAPCDIKVWYQVYRDTARRKGFYYEQCDYFIDLFRCAEQPEFLDAVKLDILVAQHEGKVLAGLILGSCGQCGYYLYAGSLDERREFMSSYGLQWKAIQILRSRGCLSYDLMGIPPNGDPSHPMAGLYTFKTGLGGRVVHYAGCWDYPFDVESYIRLRNGENMKGI